jgi:hypothetical protein
MVAMESITSRLAARAPRAAAGLRRSVRTARNRPRARGFSVADETYDPGLLAELVARGIAVRPFDQMFSDRGALDELRELAERSPPVHVATQKEFLQRLMPARVGLCSAGVRLALEPQAIGLANAYLGMRSYLRGLDLWRNVPTDQPPKLSQLWHRDWDDLINLKYFVYLSDVTEGHGPFTFAPGTHPRGDRQLDVTTRLGDEEMAERIAPDDWVVCTGPVGTVVIADTCGYHKGGKPVAGERLLWTAQFTTGAAEAKRNFELVGDGDPALTRSQRYALFEKPWRTA